MGNDNKTPAPNPPSRTAVSYQRRDGGSGQRINSAYVRPANAGVPPNNNVVGGAATNVSNLGSHVDRGALNTRRENILPDNTLGVRSNAAGENRTLRETGEMNNRGNRTLDSIVHTVDSRSNNRGNVSPVVTGQNQGFNNNRGNVARPVVTEQNQENSGINNRGNVPRPVVAGPNQGNSGFNNRRNVTQPVVAGPNQGNSGFNNRRDVPLPVVTGQNQGNSGFNNRRNVPQPVVTGQNQGNSGFNNGGNVPQPVVTGQNQGKNVFNNRANMGSAVTGRNESNDENSRYNYRRGNRRNDDTRRREENVGYNHRRGNNRSDSTGRSAENSGFNSGRGNRRAQSANDRDRGGFNPRGGNRRSNFENTHDEKPCQGPNSGQPNRRGYQGPNRPAGFKYLTSLLDEESDSIISKIDGNKGFALLLEQKMSRDLLIIVVKILKKVCDSSFNNLKITVLQKYLHETFIGSLREYITGLAIQDSHEQYSNKHFWNDPDDFWNNIIDISKTVTDIASNFACEALPKLLQIIQINIPIIEDMKSIHISDDIKRNINDLVNLLLTMIERRETAKRQVKRSNDDEDEELEPPDDFREISIYPTAYEIASTEKSFLRKNVIDKPYKSVDHYLDIQFRLLREDFVGPLRTGVTAYLSKSDKKIHEVRIHKRVHFIQPETVNEQYCFKLKFDFQQKKRSFKYENSRRFMFGSLLCFTSDGFKSVLFGKITSRDEKYLLNGELVVGFDDTVDVKYNTDYLMVECSVYFEPYFHVLSVLQQDISEENFPMRKYLIDVDSSAVAPSFVRNSERAPYYRIQEQTINLLNWPYEMNFYDMNLSQKDAFQAALTQEFSIIQGPPGTGKTYLGLKIVKTLVENRQFWYKRSPMLIICYTNHALDQFLEGVLTFTDQIVRVGGQSKNDNLNKFNLRKISQGQNFNQTRRMVNERRHDVKGLLTKIQNITESMDTIKRLDSVLNISLFAEVIPDYYNSWFARASTTDVLKWLLGGRVKKQREPSNLLEQARGYMGTIGETIDGDILEDDGEIDEEEQRGEGFIDDDVFDPTGPGQVSTLFNVVDMTNQLHEYYKKLDSLENDASLTELEKFLQQDSLTYEAAKLQDDLDYIQMNLNRAKNEVQRPFILVDNTLPDVHNLSPRHRWQLYFHFLNLYYQHLITKHEGIKDSFKKVYKAYTEAREVEDVGLIKDRLIVGLTTTGAARLRSSLQSLKSPIVIVEEAAEVLEAHIVTALTVHCQQLILIGDHKQLKPSTSNYNLERFYNLGISLFERMVLNDIRCYTLDTQHRMKPEISALITPTIYPHLINHESVHVRPNIMGIDKSLYFIDHRNHESKDVETTTKKNIHEVKFLILFARHLILNGYKPENVTILAAYLGQMFELQKERRKYKVLLGDVRIVALDNYQGEECDIILLSLVRSNDEKKIGFLSIENRVCVALSRARNGFYIIGNMQHFCGSSDLWVKVKATLEEKDAIGPYLTLRCQIHDYKLTHVSCEDDFLRITEGGCDLECGRNLNCGHNCKRLCHVQDRQHERAECREPCNKLLCESDPKHVCRKMCYQECGPCKYLVPRHLKCGHTADLECYLNAELHQCNVKVLTTLPCGHEASKPCFRNVETFRCPHPCDTRVEPCGHACRQLCHIRTDPEHIEYQCVKPCARQNINCSQSEEPHLCGKRCYEECEVCTIIVKKKRTVCPHMFDIKCSEDVDLLLCTKPCKTKLPCGHPCKNKCHESCGPCVNIVDKIVPDCNHKVKVKCHVEANKTHCKGKCPRVLSCGHVCNSKCFEVCSARKCKEMIDCTIPSPCGHTIKKIQCSIMADYISGSIDKNDLLAYCTVPCTARLNCGPKFQHACSGTCGKCAQGRFHQRCGEKCGQPLVCNHECEIPCREACKPCQKKCSYECRHSRCKKKCGEICNPCMEDCRRRCKHRTCTKKCGQVCSVEPCEEPCEKMLECGHSCVGFCGDPCPPLCRVCHKDELEEIFFGTEDEEDARFVYLKDCKHTMESTGLDNWFAQDENEIKIKVCPKCKTPIFKTERFSDFVKKAMNDIANVKKKQNGSVAELNTKRKMLQERLDVTLVKIMGSRDSLWRTLNVILQKLHERLGITFNNKRQHLSNIQITGIEAKVQIIEYIVNDAEQYKVQNQALDALTSHMELLTKVLTRDQDTLTAAEIEDINLELNRIKRSIQYHSIIATPQYANAASDAKMRSLKTQVLQALNVSKRFTADCDAVVQTRLKEFNTFLTTRIAIMDIEERKMIVRAVGLSQGHWYKCPNGHPYAIGECGGANQISKCYECGAAIGGLHHRLVDNNAVATEMDGARHGAWSEANNMANFGNLRNQLF